MTKLNFLSVLVLAIIGLFLCIDLAYAGTDPHTVAAWTFDEGQGNTTKDVSGNGHDGKLVSGAEWSKEGKIGGCIEFDGVESYVEVSHHDLLNLKAFTIEAWVKVGPKDGNHSILHKTGPGGGTERNYILNVRSSNGVLRAGFTGDGASQTYDGITDVMDDTWHHIAASYDGDVGRIYVDGELDAEIQMGFKLEPNDSPITIGKAGGTQTGRTAGLIDEVRLSNVARTQDEIKQLMNKGLAVVLAVNAGDKLAVAWGAIKLGI